MALNAIHLACSIILTLFAWPYYDLWQLNDHMCQVNSESFHILQEWASLKLIVSDTWCNERHVARSLLVLSSVSFIYRAICKPAPITVWAVHPKSPINSILAWFNFIHLLSHSTNPLIFPTRSCALNILEEFVDWNRCNCSARFLQNKFNSLRPSDAYMRQWSNHHWFR